MYHPDLLRHPEGCPALVLNADYTPLSYYPLSLWPWQTAVKAVFLERVDIVAYYQREVHSPSRAMQLPSVIALRQYVRPSEYPAFTRFNLFLRDRFQCQYCGSLDRADLRSCPAARAGRADDLGQCRHRLRALQPQERRPDARARRICSSSATPIRPTSWQLQEHGRSFPPNYLHDSWRDYLYWDIELEA